MPYPKKGNGDIALLSYPACNFTLFAGVFLAAINKLEKDAVNEIICGVDWPLVLCFRRKIRSFCDTSTEKGD